MKYTLQGTINGKYETVAIANSNDGKQYSIGDETVTAEDYIRDLYLMLKNSNSQESYRIISE